MKAFLIFAAIMFVAVAGWLLSIELDRRAAVYEARLVGALSAIEDELGAAVVDLYAPSLEPAGETGLWRVDGMVARRGADGAIEHQPYAARLRSLCDVFAELRCWRLEGLAVAGRRVMAGTPPASDPNTGPQPIPAAVPTPAPTIAPEEPEIPDRPAAPRTSPPPPAATAPSETGPGVPPAVTAPLPPPEAATQRASSGEETGNLVLRIQRRLKQAGFDPGPLDGIMGPSTRAAIEAFQQARGLPVDGAATPALLERLAGSDGPGGQS